MKPLVVKVRVPLFSCMQVDKVTGRFNGQFKTYAICGAIRRMVSVCLAPYLERERE